MSSHIDLVAGSTSFRVPRTVAAESGARFEVGDRIAAGGNGVVHQCIDARSGEELAIKFQMQMRGRRRERFAREVALHRTIEHEHLIRYRDSGMATANGRTRDSAAGTNVIPFLVMDRADGCLSSLLGDGRTVTYETYASQFIGLAGALGAMHARAVHRDIKPENIFVQQDRWLLSDFGLCSWKESDGTDLTRENEVIGPRFWMSPEGMDAISGEDHICEASDVFQLAAIFWYVICGRHPIGVLKREDWVGPDKLFEPIFLALHYDRRSRPTDGTVFESMLRDAARSF